MSEYDVIYFQSIEKYFVSLCMNKSYDWIKHLHSQVDHLKYTLFEIIQKFLSLQCWNEIFFFDNCANEIVALTLSDDLV